MMYVKITSKRQVTFPKHVLDAIGVEPGDQLELQETSEGLMLRPRRIKLELFGTLRDKIPPDHEPFDIRKFQDGTYDPSFRD